MELDLTGLVIVVGNYGSGKTEVAVNLALQARQKGLSVQIADLDLVNPYFRTRDAAHVLEKLGVEAVLPPERMRHADLPVLSPRIGGLIRAPQDLTILDVGGNNVGALVLAALADHIAGRSLKLLQVVNPFRPFSETVAECQQIRRAIEIAAGLAVNAWVGNPNLMEATTWEEIQSGYRFLVKLGEVSGLPLKCLAVEEKFVSQARYGDFKCPLLPIYRQLVPPWRKSAPVAPSAPLFKNLG